MVAENGWVLITGGRDSGVMKAASEGAKQIDGSLTVGILPTAVTEVCPAVDVPIITDIGEARNNVIVRSASVVIGCGASDAGTASEIALAIKAGKPVILLEGGFHANAYFRDIGEGRVRTAVSPTEAIALARILLTTEA